jgi:NitT/TauT family transport system substrate-binding protein
MALVDALVMTQAAEQKVPVKSVAAYYQRTPIVLISPKAKPITDVKQLSSGAKIGTKRASTTSQALTALMAVAHIDPKTVNVVDIGFGVQPLLVGQVDALMGFTMNESIEAEKAGMPVHELMLADHGVNAYGLVVATSDKFLKSNPEVVAAFVRATRRAVAETLAHKQAAAESLAKAVSEIDVPREVLVVEKTAPFWMVRGKDAASFGSQDLQGWQQTVDTAKRVGLLENAPAAKDLFAAGPGR